MLAGAWGLSQSVTGKVYIDYSGINTNKYREIELRLRTSISAHNCTGYEVDYAVSVGSGELYVFVARWNGTYGSFTDISSGGVHGPQYRLSTGDVLSATVTNTSAHSATIKAYINGSLVLTGIDNNAFTNGSPGIGFDGDMQGDFNELKNYGFTMFTASDGLTNPPVALVTMVTNEQFSFSFSTLANQSYTIEQTPDLAQTNWSPVTNLLGTGSPYQYLTPMTNTPPELFFRVRQP